MPRNTDIEKGPEHVPELRSKEEALGRTFDDYLALKALLKQSVGPSHHYSLDQYTSALAKTDRIAVHETAETLLTKGNYDQAAKTAHLLSEAELSRKVVEATPRHKVSYETVLLAESIGNIEPAKIFLEEWAKQQYGYTTKAPEIARMIAKKDPNFVVSFYKDVLPGAKNTSHEASAARDDIATVVATIDRAYGREIMETDLHKEYGGDLAGKIAIAIGDRESAKKAYEKAVKHYRPNSAVRLAQFLGDAELLKKAIHNAKGFGAKTYAETALQLDDTIMAKEAVEQLLKVRAEKIAKNEYNANSTDSGENNEKAAMRTILAIAEKDHAYGKTIVEKYFEATRQFVGKPKNTVGDKKDSTYFAAGVSCDNVGKIGVMMADSDPAYARTIADRLLERGETDKFHTVRAAVFKRETELLHISHDEAVQLLKSGRDKTALAVGWYLPEQELAKVLEKVPLPAIQRTARLGNVFTKKSDEYTSELAEISFESSDDKGFERLLSRSLLLFDYDQASSILLQKVKSSTDPSDTLRYLKTLIEIENPKGRTIATDLFTNRSLDPRIRRYLAAKLIESGHWQKSLGPIVKEYEDDGMEVFAEEILVAMIKDLGLVPDKESFEALQKKGLLQGETLEERVHELKALRAEFATTSHAQLKERLKDPRMRKMYYLVRGGEYRYTLINNYTYEKFSLVVDKILAEEIDDTKIEEFGKAIDAAGINPEKRQSILEDMKAGRFPLEGHDRSFSFDASIELGSEHEIAFERLQEIWGRELKAVALASDIRHEEKPTVMGEALVKAEGKDVTGAKALAVLKFLRHGEKQDYDSVKKIADSCKKELVGALKQKAKQTGDKAAQAARIHEIEHMTPSEALHAFLNERLPGMKDSPLLLEWQSHVRDVLSTLQAGPVKSGTKKKKMELTFLNKGKDFVRAMRFADGRQCCFNSNNYSLDGETRSAADWIALLNADPLSFVMDMKEVDSTIVSGFVFGRMGIDPKTKRPIIMLNGIYAQDSGPSLTSNILKLIEEKFAKQIGASSIMIASKHGGTLAKIPEGYVSAKKEVTAIRALKGAKTLYDDIGSVANGTFTFEGYERKLV